MRSPCHPRVPRHSRGSAQDRVPSLTKPAIAFCCNRAKSVSQHSLEPRISVSTASNSPWRSSDRVFIQEAREMSKRIRHRHQRKRTYYGTPQVPLSGLLRPLRLLREPQIRKGEPCQKLTPPTYRPKQSKAIDSRDCLETLQTL